MVGGRCDDETVMGTVKPFYPFCLYLSHCLSIFVSTCLSHCDSLSVSLLFISHSVSLSVCVSVSITLLLCLSPSLCLSVHATFHRTVLLSTEMSVGEENGGIEGYIYM